MGMPFRVVKLNYLTFFDKGALEIYFQFTEKKKLMKTNISKLNAKKTTNRLERCAQTYTRSN